PPEGAVPAVPSHDLARRTRRASGDGARCRAPGLPGTTRLPRSGDLRRGRARHPSGPPRRSWSHLLKRLAEEILDRLSVDVQVAQRFGGLGGRETELQEG